MTRDDRHRDDCEVYFIGKITASISHELMNVLATIRESSGLIEDLMVLDDTSFPYREKLSRTLMTIRRQVNRGLEIGGRLNRFAHSMDSRVVRLEVRELLGQIAALMQRLAGMRRVELRVEGAEASVEIETDPLRLQMVIAACIEYCLDRTADGGTIGLECRRRGEGIAILCRGNPGLVVAEDARAVPRVEALYNNVLDEFRDNLTAMKNHESPTIELFLPCHRTRGEG